MAKTIIILGGSYAGVHIAHYLLKHHIPDTKIVLVSKNDHFYWNLASVRAVIPGQIKDEQLFTPLINILKQYPEANRELIIGTAERANLDDKTVQVTTSSGETRTIKYDHLILATGGNCPQAEVPWKAPGTYEETLSALHTITEKVKAAKSYIVGGAGATGIELAGELGFEYGKDKEVVLLSADPEIIGGDSTAAAARNELSKLNVKIKTNARVTGTRALPDGRTEVSLANGETLTTDLYLPAVGMIPNSQYVDSMYLNDKGYVVVDEYFHVKGHKDAWAVGDIVGKPRCGFLITQKHAAGVAKNIELVLKDKHPLVVKDPAIDVLACAIGRSRGAGRFGPVKALSIMVWMGKGRTLGLDKAQGYIDGSVA